MCLLSKSFPDPSPSGLFVPSVFVHRVVMCVCLLRMYVSGNPYRLETKMLSTSTLIGFLVNEDPHRTSHSIFRLILPDPPRPTSAHTKVSHFCRRPSVSVQAHIPHVHLFAETPFPHTFPETPPARSVSESLHLPRVLRLLTPLTSDLGHHSDTTVLCDPTVSRLPPSSRPGWTSSRVPDLRSRP